jgi:hypothetical protein
MERKDKKTSTYCGHVEDDIVPCSRVQGNCFNDPGDPMAVRYR